MPDDWTAAVVLQGNELIEDSIVTSDSKQYIVFKAVPDGGDVLITQKVPTQIKKGHRDAKATGAAPVTMLQNNFVVDAQQFNNAALTVTLFDISGKVLTSQMVARSQSVVKIPFDKFTTSVFVAHITGGGTTWTGKIIPNR